MIPSVDVIRKVLDKLVTPKYPKIIDYEVEMEMDENSSLITTVDVFLILTDIGIHTTVKIMIIQVNLMPISNMIFLTH